MAFPIAVWNYGIRVISKRFDTNDPERGSFVYKTSDNGLTFEKLGHADVNQRWYDEHMIIELKSGVLAMYVRTLYGIGVSYSTTGGRHGPKAEIQESEDRVQDFFAASKVGTAASL